MIRRRVKAEEFKFFLISSYRVQSRDTLIESAVSVLSLLRSYLICHMITFSLVCTDTYLRKHTYQSPSYNQ